MEHEVVHDLLLQNISIRKHSNHLKAYYLRVSQHYAKYLQHYE